MKRSPLFQAVAQRYRSKQASGEVGGDSSGSSIPNADLSPQSGTADLIYDSDEIPDDEKKRILFEMGDPRHEEFGDSADDTIGEEDNEF